VVQSMRLASGVGVPAWVVSESTIFHTKFRNE
jgi:hypothetical protein